MEHKNLPIKDTSIKMLGDGRKFAGYASMFGGVDSYGDTIVKGAYEKTLSERERPIQMRWNHHGPVIGKWTQIKEDDYGLYVEGELTEGHSGANDAYALIKHGAIDGMSIGFRLNDSEMVEGVHYLKEIDLVEISLVETPADLGAKVTDVKSAIEQAESRKEYESILRNVGGFSWADAKALVTGIKSLDNRNDESKKGSEMDALIQRINEDAQNIVKRINSF